MQEHIYYPKIYFTLETLKGTVTIPALTKVRRVSTCYSNTGEEKFYCEVFREGAWVWGHAATDPRLHDC